MKTLLGILLILTSFVFLVWKFIGLDLSFGLSLVLNILAFMVFGIGLMLMGVKQFGASNAKSSPALQAPPPEGERKPEKTELKKFKEENHDKYKPK